MSATSTRRRIRAISPRANRPFRRMKAVSAEMNYARRRALEIQVGLREYEASRAAKRQTEIAELENLFELDAV